MKWEKLVSEMIPLILNVTTYNLVFVPMYIYLLFPAFLLCYNSSKPRVMLSASSRCSIHAQWCILCAVCMADCCLLWFHSSQECCERAIWVSPKKNLRLTKESFANYTNFPAASNFLCSLYNIFSQLMMHGFRIDKWGILMAHVVSKI